MRHRLRKSSWFAHIGLPQGLCHQLGSVVTTRREKKRKKKEKKSFFSSLSNIKQKPCLTEKESGLSLSQSPESPPPPSPRLPLSLVFAALLAPPSLLRRSVRRSPVYSIILPY
jgi:hypothetical protein